MSDLTEALARAAAPPTREPSVAELHHELRIRDRRRRLALGVLSGFAVVAATGLLFITLRPDDQRVVSATGGSATPSSVPLDPVGAHAGDRFCEPQLTNAGYRIMAPAQGVVPNTTEQAAIEQARAYVGNETGSFGAYLAMVSNPVAEKFGLVPMDVARLTWVVEVSGIVPSPRGTNLRGGAVNPEIQPPYRMVAFVDDATGTGMGTWAACSQGETTAVVASPTTAPAARAATSPTTLSSTTVSSPSAPTTGTPVPPSSTPEVTTSTVPLQNPAPGCGGLVAGGLPTNCPAQGIGPVQPGPPAGPASIAPNPPTSSG